MVNLTNIKKSIRSLKKSIDLKKIYSEHKDTELMLMLKESEFKRFRICINLLSFFLDKQILHLYTEEIADEISKEIPQYYELMNSLIKKIDNKTKQNANT